MAKSKVLAQAILLALLAGIIPACGGGGDTAAAVVAILTTPEVEPDNDVIGTATPLGSSLAGAGDLIAANDVDFWSFDAAAGDLIEIEAQAYRCDQTAWSATGNRLRLDLFAPDMSTQLVTNFPFTVFSPLDNDIALFRIQTAGTHYLKLSKTTPASAGGKYALAIRKSTIPDLQFEAEAVGANTNDTVATAEPVVPGTLFGNKEASSVDCYSFMVTAPSVFRVSINAYRNGVAGTSPGRIDPYIYLLNSAGTTLKLDDDDIFFDSGFAYQINTPGTYIIEVSHFSGTATPIGPYFLTFALDPVGSAFETEANNSAVAANPISYGSTVNGVVLAADDDYFSFSGSAGDMIEFQLLNLPSDVQGSTGALITPTLLDIDGTTPLPFAVGGGDLRISRAILRSSGTFYIQLTTASGTPEPYVLRLHLVQSSGMEAEPNDTIATATPFPGGGKVTGTLSSDSDLDLYSFPASAGELVIFSIQAGFAEAYELSSLGSSLTPTLTLLDASNATLTTASVDTRGTSTGLYQVEVSFVAPADGVYAIQVGGTSGPDGHYTLVKR